jgi:hypothetical protein
VYSHGGTSRSADPGRLANAASATLVEHQSPDGQASSVAFGSSISFQCFGPDPRVVMAYRKSRADRRRAEIRTWIAETSSGAFISSWIRRDVLTRGWFRRV